ncbi:hypothetical protein SAMN05660653_00213 [Desulfonatronum thiosulfatophilum]|uniref:DUF4292 domain-containing protein n=1 Tax=Desulfonatronum thiosulfatophilum TaxID=617002 RepID=A0A1G6A7S1_9BACT|nr:hypothetical protein [Desulfonatronum thiosulfatophilum]SDB04455.1 hypothetical protein SAMN05660653_00213 [Desulfonatronum thiosulfatophilum]
MIAANFCPSLWLRCFLGCCVLLGALTGGCAPKTLIPLDIAPEQADLVWNRFHQQYAANCTPLDFSLRASVNYASPDQQSRIVLAMWGRTDFPVRLDIRAGVGAMLAHWREGDSGWVGYSPTDNAAYFADSVQEGAQEMGLFMPLRLNALAQLLVGCWQTVVSPNYQHVQSTGGSLKFSYSINGMNISIHLTPDGHPLSIRQETPAGWVVDIDQWTDEARRIPRRISLYQGDQSAVVRVQRLDLDVDPWQDHDLRLELPPGTRFINLSR